MSQGTEGLLSFAAELRQDAENSEAFFAHRKTAVDLRKAAEVIERLAPLDGDIEAVHSDN